MNGDNTSTAISTQSPPANVQPFLNKGLSESERLYDQGPQSYYPGQTVTPFSSQTQQALDATQARATNGSPVTTAAQNLTTDTLNGNYLNSNPYLDKAFGNAAQATQSQLSSEFARSGRDVSASLPARSSQLDDLATKIYYGNYNDERNRQQGAIGQANPLANQDYTDLGALQTVGNNYDDLQTRKNADAATRFDFNQNAPQTSLNNYLSRILGQPGGTTSTTTPLYHNNVAGGLGGATLGSQIGGSFGDYSGLGALLGGILGYKGS